MVCEYGCNKEAKYRLKNGKNCCCKHSASCEEVRRKNSEASAKAHAEGRKQSFSKEAQVNSNISRIKNLKEKPFEQWGRVLKDELILHEQEGKCAHCPTGLEWNGKTLKFELDHIDGDSSNNKRENLRLLCPNCHSQTDTWKGKQRKPKGRLPDKDDSYLVEALKTSNNIRQALKKIGLTGRGYNYVRAYRLIMEYNIKMPS